MRVLVDTSVWSLVLRREANVSPPVLEALKDLVSRSRVAMLGAIRQEVLSGIRSEQQFEKLRQHLAAFPDEPVFTQDYEEAARIYNRCRQNGIQGSNADFLICAAALRLELEIFTFDRDFEIFARWIPIRLYNFQKDRA